MHGIWFPFKGTVIHCFHVLLYTRRYFSFSLWCQFPSFSFCSSYKPYQPCFLLQRLSAWMGSILGRNASPRPHSFFSHITYQCVYSWKLTWIMKEHSVSGNVPFSSVPELKASIFISCFELPVIGVFSESLVGRSARTLGLFMKKAYKESKRIDSWAPGREPTVYWRTEVQSYCSPNTARVSFTKLLAYWASVWFLYVKMCKDMGWRVWFIS